MTFEFLAVSIFVVIWCLSMNVWLYFFQMSAVFLWLFGVWAWLPTFSVYGYIFQLLGFFAVIWGMSVIGYLFSDYIHAPVFNVWLYFSAVGFFRGYLGHERDSLSIQWLYPCACVQCVVIFFSCRVFSRLPGAWAWLPIYSVTISTCLCSPTLSAWCYSCWCTSSTPYAYYTSRQGGGCSGYW